MDSCPAEADVWQDVHSSGLRAPCSVIKARPPVRRRAVVSTSLVAPDLRQIPFADSGVHAIIRVRPQDATRGSSLLPGGGIRSLPRAGSCEGAGWGAPVLQPAPDLCSSATCRATIAPHPRCMPTRPVPPALRTGDTRFVPGAAHPRRTGATPSLRRPRSRRNGLCRIPRLYRFPAVARSCRRPPRRAWAPCPCVRPVLSSPIAEPPFRRRRPVPPPASSARPARRGGAGPAPSARGATPARRGLRLRPDRDPARCVHRFSHPGPRTAKQRATPRQSSPHATRANGSDEARE